MRLIVILLVTAFVAACGGSEPDVSVTRSRPAAGRGSDSVLGLGYLYWTYPAPLLCHDWYLVVGGTVLDTQTFRMDAGNAEGEYDLARYLTGTIRVERVFLARPTAHDTVPDRFLYLHAEGLDGLKPGDRAIVFATEYDGGYGVIGIAGSNCRAGIAVRDWNEPIVDLVAKMTAHRGDPADLLADSANARLWRRYSPIGRDRSPCWGGSGASDSK